MIVSAAGSRSLTRLDGLVGVVWVCARAISTAESPANVRLPVNSSYMTSPSA